MAQTIPMGIGNLGFNNLIFKRKFRYTFELFDICGTDPVPRHYVKLAARPSLSIEETEVNFLNAKTWIPGKAAWETITVTYIDVATTEAAPLFRWLASVYNFTDPINLQQGSIRDDYAATAVIKLWDGCGTLLETWEMRDVWPTAVNFGDLDYANSEEATIELTLRYSDVTYMPECPIFPIDPCCTECGTGNTTAVVF
tara:strand:- start:459 stop:1052 length:594 start_codon:yes stop_codon:yes gene_type:complete